MLRVRDYLLASNKINEEIIIVNISDIHSEVERLTNALSYAKSIKADIITIPGDLFDSFENEQNDKIVEILNNYKDSLIFISIGNHDLIEFDRAGFFAKVHEKRDFKYFNKLTSDNIKVLSNKDIIKYKNLEIMGFDPGYDWYVNTHENKEKFNLLMQEYLSDKNNSSKFRMLLIHSCNALLVNNKIKQEFQEVNLVLSGHNHAGIMPEIFQGISKYNRGIIGPFEKWFMKSSYGFWTKGNMSIVLSNGLTKMGKSHGPKWLCALINSALKDDIDVIKLVKGDKHTLELKGKELKRLD